MLQARPRVDLSIHCLLTLIRQASGQRAACQTGEIYDAHVKGAVMSPERLQVCLQALCVPPNYAGTHAAGYLGLASAFPAFGLPGRLLDCCRPQAEQGTFTKHVERGSHVIEGITGALLAVLFGVKHGRDRRERQLCWCDASCKASGLRTQSSA